MKTLIFFLFLAPLSASAGLIASIGPAAVEGYGSEAKTSGDVSYLKVNPTVGGAIDLEVPFLYFFSANLGINISNAEGAAEYNLRKSNILNKSDLRTRTDTVDLLLGGRFRFINFKRFKMFVGGGFMAGQQKLRFNKDDYVTKFGAIPTGFMDKEEQTKSGKYLEAGLDFAFTPRSAIRLAVRKVQAESKPFETLDDKRVAANYTHIGVFYMHYFNLKLGGK